MFQHFIYFGGGLACLLALGQLARRLRPENLLLFLLFLSIGLFQIFLGMLMTGEVVEFPYSIVVVIFFVCIFGPLFYLYFRYISDETYHIKPKLFLHLIPGIIASCILTVYAFTTDILESAHLATLLADKSLGELGWIIISAVVYVSYYILLFSRHLPAIFSPAATGDKKKLKHILIITALAGVVAAAVLIFAIADVFVLGWLSGFAITAIFIYVFFISQRYPDLILFLVEEEKKRRYERSQLSNVDLKGLKQQLDDLMLKEKVYCDEDLSLRQLASQLDVTAHQLSEFLNHQLDTSFKSYINRFRVEEAKRLLLEDQERSTLSIAYAVGFNSSSAFHSAFRREAGQSPGQYRKGKSA